MQSDLDSLSNMLNVPKYSLEIDDLPTNGTEGYYLSPHALGRQFEVHQSLIKIAPEFKIQRTEYNHS